MLTKHPHRWPKTTQILIFACASLVFSAFVFAGYWYNWQWLGFNASIGPDVQQYQPAKTLWDWMQLLIVPVALAIGALLFNQAASKNEQKIAQQRDQTALDIAADNQREALLQTYLDRMSELLLDRHLLTKDVKNEIRNIARARTLTVLSRLDADRKGSLLQFLYESDLINIDIHGCIISMKGANLSEANLSEANLSEANLSEANLSEATLSEANLFGADLNRANLSGTDLSKANLFGADLSQANLNGANLCRADLSGANLSRADLSGTDLSGANLSRADLSGADLHGVDLRGADLRETDLNKADLSEAIMNYQL
ncbi:pentapeptide repeat-containing protein [Dictyobacter aurantiacus]|uniref:Pentapeptide repeat-containing protein n=1 Tax=Dictyobacter aurantiacus TaxID=1936993 RepID=A0A401ZSM0_9CHLR|nr:pentapeptide repeat-containing protein [Dictyobacter aurantiacus]GCE09780.1 hypothetical protein KDAU_71090 [Dictyobacter aurantiacus]